MAKNINRTVTIYINGREVENTLQSIRNEVTKLEREQRKLPIGSEEYIKKGEEIAELKKILLEQKTNVADLGNTWEHTTQKMAEYSNILMGIQSAFQMLDLGIGKVKDLAKAAAELDDAYGQVMKTTGLTHDEVEQLNELFKKMDTRTSREQLNELAYEAGKLGIQGVKDVAAFVDASDKINVALGDVLGNGAMVTIGKMAQVYAGSTDELAASTGNLQKQMLAIGSAVNELGKLSTANEHYLVDFAGRMGGIAVQAGLSADQILGFASALDQDMQKVEMSATAFQKFIGQIMKKPEEFAKQAGMAVSDFSQLVRTDLNEALFRVLQGFSGKGGYAELVNIFKDLGLDGARAASVISAMSNSIDKIKIAQAAANEQLKSGESIMGEYNTMNNTRQAQAEKAKKRFEEVRIELGNELYPVLISLQRSGTVLMKGVAGVAQLLKSYPVLIAPIIAGLIAWNRYRIVSIVTSGRLVNALKTVTGIKKIEAAATAFQAKSDAKLRAEEEASRLQTLKNQLAIEKENLARQKSKVGMEAQSLVLTNEASVKKMETAVTNQATVAEQAHANAIKAKRAVWMAMPWGMIITALTTIVALGVKAYQNSENFKVDKAQKEANRLAGEAQGHLLVLKERLAAAKEGTNEYKKALEELRNEYPEIIAKHVDEEGKLRNLEKAYEDLSEAALQNARDRIFAEKTETAYGELAEKEADVAASIMKKITWEKGTSDEVKDEVERILSEQLRLITSGKKNIEVVLKDFAKSIHKYGATISNEMYAEYTFSDNSLIKDELKDLQKAYEKTESLVNRYRKTLKPLKEDEEDVTYSILESARKRKEALEAEITVLKKRMDILSKKIGNGYDGQALYERMKSQLYDLEATARGAANEIVNIEKALSGMSIEQMKARKAAVNQEILTLQSKIKVMESMAYIDFMTKKQLEDDRDKIEQLNREWLVLSQEIKKAEEAAAKAANDVNGAGSGKETPAQKKARLAQEAWQRFGDTYERLIEKMDAKTQTGAAKIVADIDNSVRKMEDDLKLVTGKNATEAAEKLENLKKKAAEWKAEQLDAYIEKLNAAYWKLAESAGETDAAGRLVAESGKLRDTIASVDAAIVSAEADAAVATGKHREELERLIAYYRELKSEISVELTRRIQDVQSTIVVTEEKVWNPEKEEWEIKPVIKMDKSRMEKQAKEAADGIEKTLESIEIEPTAFKKWVDINIEIIEGFADKALSIFSNINTLLNNISDQRIKDLEDEKEAGIKSLDQQLEQGLISKETYEQSKTELEEKYTEKANEEKKKQWQRDKAYATSEATINAALAAIKLWAAEGGTAYKIAMSAALAAEMATQIAAITKQPEPYAKGGYVPRRTVYQAGEAGPEWVASNQLLSDPQTAPIIQTLEDYQRGNRHALADIPMAQLDMPAAISASEQIGHNRVVVQPQSAAAVWEHPTAAAVGNDSREMVNLMRELVTYEKDPRNRQAVISRRTMDDFNNNENFLRNRARL